MHKGQDQVNFVEVYKILIWMKLITILHSLADSRVF